jgi:hypothetical protein
VDNDCRHKAKAGAQGLARPPRCAVLWWPPSWPRAKPMERAWGAGHAQCPRHPTRQRLSALGREGEPPRRAKGPWQYKRSPLSEAPEVTVAVERIAAAKQLQMAA